MQTDTRRDELMQDIETVKVMRNATGSGAGV